MLYGILIPLSTPSSCRTIVVVRFKAVGNAPIMKQNFYKITASNRFQAVIQFLRKEKRFVFEAGVEVRDGGSTGKFGDAYAYM